MKSLKCFRLYDTVESTYIHDLKNPGHDWTNPPVLSYVSKKKAEKFKDNYLDAGNYPDKPHTVIEIKEFSREFIICGGVEYELQQPAVNYRQQNQKSSEQLVYSDYNRRAFLLNKKTKKIRSII